MRILVTGGTGLVGNNVVRRLVQQHHDVAVLVREHHDPRPFADVDVELRRGDIRDRQAVSNAVAGVDAVIHAAADTHIGRRYLQRQRAVNVDGTQHVAAAARERGARLVHVSSVDALPAGTRNQPADEDTIDAAKADCGYVVTKREAEQAVLRLVEDGLDAVIVNPGFMLGPWDWKPSSGRMLLRVAGGLTPFAPKGGYSVCDVRDVAMGIVAGLEKGTRGRRYILAGHNMRYVEAWRLFAKIAGGSPPLCPAGPLMRIIAGRWGDLCTMVTGQEGDVNSAAVRMSELYHYYSSDRAERELGYRPRSANETVQDAWQWFTDHGYATPKRR